MRAQGICQDSRRAAEPPARDCCVGLSEAALQLCLRSGERPKVKPLLSTLPPPSQKSLNQSLMVYDTPPVAPVHLRPGSQHHSLFSGPYEVLFLPAEQAGVSEVWADYQRSSVAAFSSPGWAGLHFQGPWRALPLPAPLSGHGLRTASVFPRHQPLL